MDNKRRKLRTVSSPAEDRTLVLEAESREIEAPRPAQQPLPQQPED